MQGTFAYVGCYAEGLIEQFDISNPGRMQPGTRASPGFLPRNGLFLRGIHLLVTDGASGGQVYQIDFRQF